MCLVGPYLDGGSPYYQLLSCGVVLSMLRGTGIASDQTEVTAIPSVLAGSVQRVYSCQSRCAWLGSTSPYSSKGSRQWRGHEPLVCRAAKAEGRGCG
jgi:hypothetical protein